MRYHDYEEKRRMKIIENDLKAELRNKIVEIFANHNIKSKGEDLCNIFTTLEERNAGYGMVLELHQNWLKNAIATAIDITKYLYQNSKQIAA